MWAYLAAPFLVLVPARWRRDASFTAPVHWRVASFVCGVMQCVTGLGALVWWYSYSVANWAQTVMAHAATQSAGSDLKPEAFGVLGLTIVAASPITWLILAWGVEGLVRMLAAAITEEVFATLPLATIAALLALVRPVRAENPGLLAEADASLNESPARSFAAFLRRGVIERTHARVPDHVTQLRDADGDVLKIAASHTKADWEVGRILRFGDDYYRLENFSERRGAAAHIAPAQQDGLSHTHIAAAVSDPTGAARDGHARPFVYKLRRLGAGVLTRHVLTYDPPANVASRTEPAAARQLQRK